MKKHIQLLGLMLLCAANYAQIPRLPNMQKVCNERCSIISTSAPTTFQFGFGAKWQAPFPSTEFTMPMLVSNALLGDPYNGTAKEIDAQEHLVAYTVTFSDPQIAGGAQQTITIPAIQPVCTTPSTFNIGADGTIHIVIPAYCLNTQPGGAWGTVIGGINGYYLTITGSPNLPLFATGSGTNLPTQ